MKQFVILLLSLALLLPASSFGASQDELMQKLESLTKELEKVKQQMEDMKKQDVKKEERITKVEAKAEKAAGPSWLEFGGDYRFRFDYLSGKIHDYVQYNPFGSFTPGPGFPTFFATPTQGETVRNTNLLTNRFGLNVKAQATEDIQVKARLLMYKVWGHETMTPVQGNFFADRAFGPFDGTVAHVPSDNALRVDQAYATWSNIGNAPVWLSVGRRPSTGGRPSNLRLNTEHHGTAGVPCFLVDYAFDGMTLGVAPDIDALPGAFAKLCYGKGFDAGFRTSSLNPKDVNFLGLNVVPYDTDNLHVQLQWNRAFDIFTVPPDGFNQVMPADPTNPFSPNVTVNTPVKTNLGDIDQYGLLVMGKINKLGPGDLNLFAAGALSVTHPNTNLFQLPFASTPGGLIIGGFGLMYNDDPQTPAIDRDGHTGGLIYLGARYDLKKTGTSIGAEFNHGSKHWITFVPAGDDLWTSKLGTRGEVYELYVIQELNRKPIAKRGKAFVRLGYQYYNFRYTGSNNWVGAPQKIDDLNTQDPSKTQLLAPIKNAHDFYATFDVMF